MSWFRRHLGLDFFDLVIQALLTGLTMGFVDAVGGRPGGPAKEGLMIGVAGASVVVLAWRRQRGLKQLASDSSLGLTTGPMAATRIEELESRVGELEATEVRLLELEERLDFTERMLAQGTGERAALGNGEQR